MAVPLGQKLIIDSKQYQDYAIGITLPIQVTNIAFNQSIYTIDMVRTNIKNLLLTKRGERLMQPDFGCGLHEFLFEPLTNEIMDKIETEISNTIARWLPYVSISSIEIDTESEKNFNTILVSLDFSYTGAPNTNNQLELGFSQ
jgi:phage baseplate assembly protein W